VLVDGVVVVEKVVLVGMLIVEEIGVSATTGDEDEVACTEDATGTTVAVLNITTLLALEDATSTAATDEDVVTAALETTADEVATTAAEVATEAEEAATLDDPELEPPGPETLVVNSPLSI
jgi:hypothetical protein